MVAKSKLLAISQLDEKLKRYSRLRSDTPPKKGWIRAIRDALGMSAEQLGRRANFSQQAIAQLEGSEAEGKATIAKLRTVAKGLDCTFVYALVPNSTLADFLKRQATKVAERTVLSTAHSMSLEDQDVPDKQTQKQIDILAREINMTFPRYIWDQDGS